VADEIAIPLLLSNWCVVHDYEMNV
jgi:hypothetical protein